MRQIIYILFFILALLLSPLQAESAQQNNSVKELIEKVKRSSGDERRKAMNALKLKLRTVSQESRIAALQELRKSFASSVPHQTATIIRGNRQTLPQQQIGTQVQNGIQRSVRPGGGIPKGRHP